MGLADYHFYRKDDWNRAVSAYADTVVTEIQKYVFMPSPFSAHLPSSARCGSTRTNSTKPNDDVGNKHPPHHHQLVCASHTHRCLCNHGSRQPTSYPLQSCKETLNVLLQQRIYIMMRRRTDNTVVQSRASRMHSLQLRTLKHQHPTCKYHQYSQLVLQAQPYSISGALGNLPGPNTFHPSTRLHLP